MCCITKSQYKILKQLAKGEFFDGDPRFKAISSEDYTYLVENDLIQPTFPDHPVKSNPPVRLSYGKTFRHPNLSPTGCRITPKGLMALEAKRKENLTLFLSIFGAAVALVSMLLSILLR